MTKIAFCFLSYGDIEQKLIWEYFFKDIDSVLYSIYIHRKDRVQESWAPNSRVIPTIPTQWASFSLVDAELNLYEYAIKDDPANEYFILLSGDSIPVQSFDKIYTKITSTNGVLPISNHRSPHVISRKSKIKFNKLPEGDHTTFIKSSQWKILKKSHIEFILGKRSLLKEAFGSMHCPDEHAIAIVMGAYKLLSDVNTKSYFIHVDWSRSNKDSCGLCHNRRPTPFMYHKNDIEKSLVDSLRKREFYFMRKLCSRDLISPETIFNI